MRGFSGMTMQKHLMMGTAIVAIASASPAIAQTRQFNVPEQPASQGIPAFARQAGVQILASGNEVAQRRTNAVRGTYTVEHGLRVLLEGTGLTADSADETGIITIRPARTSADVATPITSTEILDADEHDMVVTGSRIRGSQLSAPVVTIRREDMRLSGHNDLGEVIRALPQNFGGGQNPTLAVGTSAGRSANQNNTGGSGFNLRGLGPDATLTLLNGARLPYDGFYQATDVSVVPVAAIERVEVLLDGASAIYGSDAIAGVANIILRRDYQGAEFSARYGAATDGGYSQQQYTAVAGTTWSSGGFLITGDFSKNDSVRANQRDYLAYLSFFPDYEVYPRNRQIGGLFSGHQRIGDKVELALDAFYTNRSNAYQYAAFSALDSSQLRSESTIWGLFPSARLDLPGGWNSRLHGAIGRNVSNATLRSFTITTGAPLSETSTLDVNEAQALGVDLEGPLVTLPGGAARLAIGGGWRRNTLERRSGSVVEADAGNRSYFAYGEINLPLLSERQGIPLVDRLSINAAIRHENYDSVGGTTTPKAGLTWSVVPGLDLRASWGRSFKTPTLYEQYASQFLYLVSVEAFLGGSAVGAPADAQGLLLLGGNQDLRPETAETLTAGVSVSPGFLPNLNLELNWFQVDISNRVVIPVSALAQALTNPAYAEFVTLVPSAAEISAAFATVGLLEGVFTANFASAPYDPSKLFVIVNDLSVNSADELLRGVDASARYTADALGGRLSLSANGTWLIEARRRLTGASPETPIAGVIFFPANFRGRLGASWSRARFTLGTNLNHVAGVRDTNVTPNPRRNAMTTLDVVVNYQLDSSPVGAFSVNLAVTNLFDQRPPFMQSANIFQVNYDSTNYSALGRVFSFSMTKRF